MGAIARLKEHPKGFWFVFWGELAERASFYGMRTILALYLIQVLGFHQSSGAAVMQFFIAAAYVAPLLGGWIADRWLGRYKTILYFSGPYILGHIILGGIQSRWAMYTALVLLALGSGSIKPNTSTLMGKIYEKHKKELLLTEAFSYFYAAINIGAAITSLGLPKVREYFGYPTALMIPAVLMAVAFVVFAVGKRHYPEDKPEPHRVVDPTTRAARRETLRRIAPIFALIAVFWFVYNQSASTWIYLAMSHLDRQLFAFLGGVDVKQLAGLPHWLVLVLTPVWHLLHYLSGVKITADQIQGLNPVFILLLTPMFNALWEGWKKRRDGVPVADTTKMLIGFGIVLVCMGSMAVVGFLTEVGQPTVWWESSPPSSSPSPSCASAWWAWSSPTPRRSRGPSPR